MYWHSICDSRDAQYSLGVEFLKINGKIFYDITIALKWLEKAALQQHKDAQFILGMINGSPLTTCHGDDTNIEWLQQAADQDHIEATFWLGVHYFLQFEKFSFSQYGVRDLSEIPSPHVAEYGEKSQELLKKIANCGHKEAHFLLGIMYLGFGCPKNEILASISFHESAKESKESKDGREKKPSTAVEVINDYVNQSSVGIQLDANKINIENERIKMSKLALKALEGDQEAQYEIADIFAGKLFIGKQVIYIKTVASEFYQKAASQGHKRAKLALEKLNSDVLRFTAPASGMPGQRTETTTNAVSLIPEVERQLRHLSREEFGTFRDWSGKIKNLEFSLKEIQLKMHLDLKSKQEQDYIDLYPRLKNYQNRLQAELNRFILCYFLAPAGIFKLEDNKKDAILAAIGYIPAAGSFLKILTAALSAANKKYRLYQINRVSELFKSSEEISSIISVVARKAALSKEHLILKQQEIHHEGIDKLKGYYHMVKEVLEHQWKDLSKGDKTGVTLYVEDKLAVLDCAYLLQQIMSGKAKIDKTMDLAAQFIAIIAGEPYKPVFLPAIPRPLPSSSGHLNANVREMMQELREQGEILKLHREEFEVHKKKQESELQKQQEELRKQQQKALDTELENKALLERLEKLQMQIPKLVQFETEQEKLRRKTVEQALENALPKGVPVSQAV